MSFSGQKHDPSSQVTKTFRAAAAIEKWKAVTVASQSDGYVVQCSSTGEKVTGIALNKAIAAGDNVLVCIRGLCKWIAGDAVTKGAALQADADGECIAATTADEVAGVALTAAAAADDVLEADIGYAGIY